MSRILIAAGEPEYESHETMSSFARDWRIAGHDVDLCTPTVIDDEPDFPTSEFTGLEALPAADLLVIYTRFRVLPDQQMSLLGDYLDDGRPVLGLRTSSHAFHFPTDSPWSTWNDGFGREVLGTPWVSHHGHSSRTFVQASDGVLTHPILEGIESPFEARSWLYRVRIPGEKQAQVLLHGDPIEPETDPEPGPVAWTTSHRGGGRVFYTSLGHRDDFDVPAVRHLLHNAATWCLGSE